jgi:hypothetical protein
MSPPWDHAGSSWRIVIVASIVVMLYLLAGLCLVYALVTWE